MADSVEQAGPMVQMILARRDSLPFGGIGLSSGFEWLGFNIVLDREISREMRSTGAKARPSNKHTNAALKGRYSTIETCLRLGTVDCR